MLVDIQGQLFTYNLPYPISWIFEQLESQGDILNEDGQHVGYYGAYVKPVAISGPYYNKELCGIAWFDEVLFTKNDWY